MADYIREARQVELGKRKQVILIKIERELQALENYAKQRITGTIEEVADDLDMLQLQGIVVDLETALQEFQIAQKELKRLAK